jgi:hypothetical protein
MSVLWDVEIEQRLTAPVEDDPDAVDCGMTEVMDAVADDVHHSLRFVVFWILLPAALTLLALLAAGVWWLVGRLP